MMDFLLPSFPGFHQLTKVLEALDIQHLDQPNWNIKTTFRTVHLDITWAKPHAIAGTNANGTKGVAHTRPNSAVETLAVKDVRKKTRSPSTRARDKRRLIKWCNSKRKLKKKESCLSPTVGADQGKLSDISMDVSSAQTTISKQSDWLSNFAQRFNSTEMPSFAGATQGIEQKQVTFTKKRKRKGLVTEQRKLLFRTQEQATQEPVLSYPQARETVYTLALHTCLLWFCLH